MHSHRKFEVLNSFDFEMLINQPEIWNAGIKIFFCLQITHFQSHIHRILYTNNSYKIVSMNSTYYTIPSSESLSISFIYGNRKKNSSQRSIESPFTSLENQSEICAMLFHHFSSDPEKQQTEISLHVCPQSVFPLLSCKVGSFWLRA
jgi:hypothetical protein